MIIKIYTRTISSLKTLGTKEFIKKLVLRGFYNAISIPLALTLALASPILKVRLIKLYSWRIGHFGMNTHLMLCARDLNTFKEEHTYKTFFYTDPQHPVCNQQLYNMWERIIPILPFNNICFQTDRWLQLLLGKKYNNDFKQTFESSGGGNDKWNFFELTETVYPSFTHEEHTQAKQLMQKMGLPLESKFVCVLVRDKKYMQMQFPDSTDWQYHSYRDADIQHFETTIQFLADNGYYVIRLGRHAEHQLNITHPNVIDYAFHELQCDLLDVYLSAHCSFFITTSSGIDSVAQIFRRPVLAVNMIVFDTNRSNHQNWTLCIPKKIMDTHNNKLLPYYEILQEIRPFIDTAVCPGLDRRGLFADWEKRGLILLENSSDEILEATKEMLHILREDYKETDKERLMQADFWQSISTDVDSYALRARLCTTFLKRHKHLILSPKNRTQKEYSEI